MIGAQLEIKHRAPRGAFFVGSAQGHQLFKGCERAFQIVVHHHRIEFILGLELLLRP